MAAQEVNMGKKQPGMIESIIPAVTGLIGGAVGTYYGGPAGGAAGSAVGSKVGGAAIGGGEGVGAVQSSSNPRDRFMQQQEQNPVNQLQQGKASLNGMDEQTKVMLQPALDEALKRAMQNNRQSAGDGRYASAMME